LVTSKSFRKDEPHIYGFLAGILIFILCIPVTVSAGSSEPDNIRIAVLNGAGTVRLDGTGLTAVDENGRFLEITAPVYLKSEGSGIAVQDCIVRKLRCKANGVVRVNGKGFRDVIEILPFEKGLLVINELPMEDYLGGIINSEISSQWPIEAVKAQAVVARSYAIFQKEARKDMPYQLESTVMDQAYDGYDGEDSRAVRGVKETAGEVLTYHGKVIQAFFHSSCGGHTEASDKVWSVALPYLKGVTCKYCLVSPSVRWEKTIPLKKLEALLRKSGYSLRCICGIIPLSRDESGRIGTMSIIYSGGSLNIPAVDFRKIVGYGVVRSTDFDVRISGENAVFSGKGYGHGVGLCQWGAEKRAEEGFSYREILSYYYPGTTLEKLY
jgi:stage II sporulation protein D